MIQENLVDLVSQYHQMAQVDQETQLDPLVLKVLVPQKVLRSLCFLLVLVTPADLHYPGVPVVQMVPVVLEGQEDQ